jgi:chromosome segregation ATPase
MKRATKRATKAQLQQRIDRLGEDEARHRKRADELYAEREQLRTKLAEADAALAAQKDEFARQDAAFRDAASHYLEHDRERGRLLDEIAELAADVRFLIDECAPAAPASKLARLVAKVAQIRESAKRAGQRAADARPAWFDTLANWSVNVASLAGSVAYMLGRDPGPKGGEAAAQPGG